MYEIDAVRGYVIGYHNQGESDRRYAVLTNDSGLIYARATSVRKEAAKLKHFLQKLNLVELEIVESRRGYQITGGRLIEETTQALFRSDLNSFYSKLGVLDRVGVLIMRLAINSDSDSRLFAIFEQTITQLQQVDGQSDAIEAVELWASARALVEFGYFDPNFSQNIPTEIFRVVSTPGTNGVLSAGEHNILEQNKKELQQYIRACLEQTML